MSTFCIVIVSLLDALSRRDTYNFFFFFQAEDGIRDAQESRGLGDVYKRQVSTQSTGGWQGFSMGGHGGLNILPQKSWNVWNRDNIEKVRKDEKEHAEAEAAKRKQTLDVQFEGKLQELRAKKRKRPSPEKDGYDGGDVGELALPDDGGHVNLFAEEEAADGNEEYAKEKAQEELAEKKRWQVQLGRSNTYGGEDINHVPWYSRNGPEAMPITNEHRARLEADKRAGEVCRHGWIPIFMAHDSWDRSTCFRLSNDGPN
eukprot:TRINITY_DN5131_c0_g1_i2.p1 TRINITY_DN5131_c0_g1~~TRINITY_DN5131_c0_g1_i2.p1  ORF type:complete len:258 (-),score=74.46 TRINITY_DN5131_c0_g1_i2:270-1043(-)